MFDHERLDVYKAAIEFVLLVEEVVEHLPRGKSYLADQLQRAGSSVPLNIAEGAGEYSSNSLKSVDFIGWQKVQLRSARQFSMCVEVFN